VLELLFARHSLMYALHRFDTTDAFQGGLPPHWARTLDIGAMITQKLYRSQ